ncbi:MAG: adenine phosphoribosyltransferase [Flavobacteriaceae bacterium]|nr:adenine phosphoribosyltransferase [Flavobacteriaceae bacterium]
MDLYQFVTVFDDFPKKGVKFKDISPLLSNFKALNFAIHTLAEQLEDKHIQKVVGIESRGFLLGILLAQKLEAGFVMVRKSGKLPGETTKQTYELEYGYDALEIQDGIIGANENVVIHDDVLATGGTALAAAELVEKVGANIIEFNFLMELSALAGAERIKEYNYRTLLKY